MTALPDFLDFYGKVIDKLGQVKFLPYRYNSYTQQLSFDGCLLARLIFGTHLSLLVFYITLKDGPRLLSRLYYEFGSDPAEPVRQLLFELEFLLSSAQVYVFIKHWGAHAQLITEWIELMNEIKETIGSVLIFPRKAFLLFQFLVYSTLCWIFSSCLNMYSKPEKELEFLILLVDNPDAMEPSTKILIAILVIYLSSFLSFIVLFMDLTLIVAVIVPVSILRSMRTAMTLKEKCRGRKTRNKFNRNVIHGYSQLAVLMTLTNVSLKDWVMLTELFYIKDIVGNAVVLERSGAGFTVSFVLLLMPAFFFKSLAQVHTDSVRTLESWKRVRATLWIKKCRQAFERQPLRVRLGSWYFVDRSLVLTLMTLMLSSTIKICISLRL